MTQNKFISFLSTDSSTLLSKYIDFSEQRDSINDFIVRGNHVLLSEIVNEMLGKESKLAMFYQAVEACERNGASLLVADLNIISSTLAMMVNSMRRDIKVVACDLAEENELTIHFSGPTTFEEREKHSARIRASLGDAKTRGVKLGSPENLTKEAAEKGRKLGVRSRIEKADGFARVHYNEIIRCRGQGMPLNAIAKRFNEEGVPSARGKIGSWTRTSIKNIIDRMERS